jgi:uncharacterized membrane protein
MNGQLQIAPSQPTIHSLSIKQRVFIAFLVLVGLLVSFVIVRFLDPSAALTSASSSSMRRSAESRAVLG